MIIQALIDYYERKVNDPDPAKQLAPSGFLDREMTFIVELAQDGSVTGVLDLRKTGRAFRVPQLVVSRTRGVEADLLWGNTEYVLGIPNYKKREEAASDQARARVDEAAAAKLRAFVAKIGEIPASAQDDEGLLAIKSFYAKGGADLLREDPLWPEIEKGASALTFRLEGDTNLICQRRVVVTALVAMLSKEDGDEDEGGASTLQTGVCLVTGKASTLARKHLRVTGVKGSGSIGVPLISFNRKSFCSYGKLQGNNAPMSADAAFAYATAINHLLDSSAGHRFGAGENTVVFWSTRPGSLIEDSFSYVFGFVDDPDEGSARVRKILDAVRSGGLGRLEEDKTFCVLTLAATVGRISVKDWTQASEARIGAQIAQWFEDLRVHRPAEKDAPEFPSLFSLLRVCAVKGEVDKLPPNLGGDMFRAAISGGLLPALLLNLVVHRCKAEQSVTYLRAAIIKACLNREIRAHGVNKKEFSTVLNPNNEQPAYRLGRLFAVFEKIQERAMPSVSSTIRDRYYSGACASPSIVFPTLIRLHQHHLKKLNSAGLAAYFERIVTEIMDGLPMFPGHLDTVKQGEFALGYYQQRMALSQKSNQSNVNEGDSNESE